MAKIYVIHGYESSSQKNWFRWLESFVKQENLGDIFLLDMPNPNNPSLDSWCDCLKERIGCVDLETYIIAHSLGCVACLQFLTQEVFATMGGVILVSGFDQKIKGLSLLDSFVENPLDFTKLTKQIAKRAVVAARDDTIVPFEHTQSLAQKLEADFMLYQKGNHFMGSDGFTELPIVGFLLKESLKTP